MRQLGSALVALVIMLASAALSERFIPAVASQEARDVMLARGPVAKESTLIRMDTGVVPVERSAPRELPPRIPEQLVMLLAGVVLMGLGGAIRTPRPDR